MDAVVGKIRALMRIPSQHEVILPALPLSSYEPVPFSMRYYRLIPPRHVPSATAFIDGGQALLLDTPHFCVAFLRAHAIVYKSARRIVSTTSEAYIIISASPSAHNISYTTEILPLRGSFPLQRLLSFDSLDSTIRTGTKRFSPSSVVSIARRFAELHLASEIIKTLQQEDMLLMDGSLQQSYTNEEQLLAKLKQSQEQSATVIGLSKTNSVLTTAGTSFAQHLAQFPGKWYYAPVGKPLNNSPHISFAKLHEKSSQVFMMDSFQPLEAMHYTALASYAHDPVFLGYPYGLIEADRAARITATEAASLQFQLTEKLGKSFHNFSTKNTHAILDRISF
jgi:hypothetical protein